MTLAASRNNATDIFFIYHLRFLVLIENLFSPNFTLFDCNCSLLGLTAGLLLTNGFRLTSFFGNTWFSC